MVFTSNQFGDVFSEEIDAQRCADYSDGKVVPCYYTEEHRAYLDKEVDGEFIGYLIHTPDGDYLGMEDF